MDFPLAVMVILCVLGAVFFRGKQSPLRYGVRRIGKDCAVGYAFTAGGSEAARQIQTEQNSDMGTLLDNASARSDLRDAQYFFDGGLARNRLEDTVLL